MPAVRRVALLIEATSAYPRRLLHGVAQYLHEKGRWKIYFELHDLAVPPPKWLKDWNGHGILARVGNHSTARAVQSAGVPTVELRRMIKIPGVPSIGPDNQKIAALVAHHFLERGFRHFGFCGLPRRLDPPMDLRADAFVGHLREAGFACSVFLADRSATWEQESKRMVRWIRTLPKPIGIMTPNDSRGLRVLQACEQAGIAVPDQVAVVGGGNDDCLCNLSNPPLSSVDLAPESIGYEAAALLDRMMDGRRLSAEQILTPPSEVITRLSSDVLATDDQAVIKAVSFIRNHAFGPIHVADVLKHANLSRSALDPRVKAVLGRTIHQEILRLKLNRVKLLLSTTDLPNKQIADQAGFKTPNYLSRVFRKNTGATLAGYRRNLAGHLHARVSALPHRQRNVRA